MAQDFTKDYKSQVTDSAHTLRTADSNDALIGIRLTNITASAVTVDVWIVLLKIQSSAATSIAAWVSVVDAISA
jgi:hypothetical protein